MAQKLALFLDGTWNSLDTIYQTNVPHLMESVLDKTPSGVRQVCYYDVGVGVEEGVTPVTDWMVRVAGGARGQGLYYKLESAYRFLVMNYRPGDDIYIFGFSRGAFTARSLCGLIRACGIVRRANAREIPRAMQLYKTKRPSRLSPFRRDYSYRLGTGPEDGWAETPPMDPPPEPQGERPRTREEAYQYRPLSTYRMMFLGIWDTVGSIGWAFRPRFHDTDIDELISSVRHAVAIDERRKVFGLTPIENIHWLNRQWIGRLADTYHTPWQVDAPGPEYIPYAHRPYQQVWFPGDHGAVGGGYAHQGLSNAALHWVAEGAQQSGLHLDAAKLAAWHASINPDATYDTYTGLAVYGAAGVKERSGPRSMDELSETGLYRTFAGYDPQRPAPRFVLHRPRPIESLPPGFPA